MLIPFSVFTDEQGFLGKVFWAFLRHASSNLQVCLPVFEPTFVPLRYIIFFIYSGIHLSSHVCILWFPSFLYALNGSRTLT